MKAKIAELFNHIIWGIFGCVLCWIFYPLGIFWQSILVPFIYFYSMYFSYDGIFRWLNRKLGVIEKIR